MSLRLLGSDLVHLDRGTFMWVGLTRFALSRGGDDRSLLAALVASPAYAHDYASPFPAEPVVTEPAVHGRWWRDSITADSFTPTTAAEAEARVRAWANDQEWTDPDYRQPPEVLDRLETVWAVLRSGSVHRLENPGAEQEHEYGSVVGGLGFHEFVVIDRSSGVVHLVVASDD